MATDDNEKNLSAEALAQADKAGNAALLDFFADFQRLDAEEAVGLLDMPFLAGLFRIAGDNERDVLIRENALLIIGDLLPMRDELRNSFMKRSLEEIVARESPPTFGRWDSFARSCYLCKTGSRKVK